MKILVINGSPKGESSITVQTVKYWELLHAEHSFTYLNAGQEIRALEKDFSRARRLLEEAELLLFSYPVYTFLAPSQLHRFISLLKKSGVNLRGKRAAQVTTSKHFYDTTAQRYIRENCADMGLVYLDGLYADMDDLTEAQGQKQARQFFDRLLFLAAQPLPVPEAQKQAAYCGKIALLPAETVEKKAGAISLVADMGPEDASLRAMTERFMAVCPYTVKLFNIRNYPFGGGCLGCFHCAKDGVCIYKDGFSDMLREIQSAKAIVLAFSIKDHSMGSVFKTYDDRQFANGHRTVTEGIPFGYLVSGPLSAEENLRQVIEARAAVGGNPLMGIATDETDPDGETDLLAASLAFAVENGYSAPRSFYGVGGMKIFRDLIYTMRGLMRADHAFFKARGQYDFPQKKPGRILKMYLAGALMNNKGLRAKAGSKMTEGMLAPYTKVLDGVRKEKQL